MKNNNILDFLEKTCKKYNSENKTEFYAEKTLDGNIAIDIAIINYSVGESSCYVLFEALFESEKRGMKVKVSHHENKNSNEADNEQHNFLTNYLSIRESCDVKEVFKNLHQHLLSSNEYKTPIIKIDLVHIIKTEDLLYKSLNYFKRGLLNLNLD